MAGDGLIRTPQLSSSEPPTSALGGDLSGTTAAAVVEKINGQAVPSSPAEGRLLGKGASETIGLTYMTGDFDASSGAVKVTALQNYAVQDHAPLDGEVLTWVNGNSQWEPVAPAGGASTWNDIYAAVAGSYLDITTDDKPFYLRQNNSGVHDGPVLRAERLYRSNSTDYTDALVLIHSQYDAAGTTSAPSLYVRHNMRATSIEQFGAVVDIGDYRYASGLLVKHSSGGSDNNRYLIKTEAPSSATRFYTRDNGATAITTGSDTGNTPALSITMSDGGASALKLNQTAAGTLAEFYNGANQRFFMNELGTTYIYANQGGTDYALTVSQSHADGDILRLRDVTTERWSVAKNGKIIQTPANIAASASAIDSGYEITMTSGQLGDSQVMAGQWSTVVGHASDHADSFIASFVAQVTRNSSTAEMVGFTAAAFFDWGVSSSSPIKISTDSALGQEAMLIEQADADQAFIDFAGTASADKLNNISTDMGTGGAATGPNSALWTPWRMVKHEVGGVAGWICLWQ
jgi:hypothetical protein